MTRKTTKLLLGLTAAAAIVATPLLLAGGGGSGGHCLLAGKGGMHHRSGHHGRGMAMGAFLHDLDLTSAQREQLHAIFGRAHEQHDSTREALHTALVEAARVLATDPGNVAGARAAFDARQPSIEELKTGLFASFGEAMAVLTPEQHAEVIEHLDRKSAAAAE